MTLAFSLRILAFALLMLLSFVVQAPQHRFLRDLGSVSQGPRYATENNGNEENTWVLRPASKDKIAAHKLPSPFAVNALAEPRVLLNARNNQENSLDGSSMSLAYVSHNPSDGTANSGAQAATRTRHSGMSSSARSGGFSSAAGPQPPALGDGSSNQQQKDGPNPFTEGSESQGPVQIASAPEDTGLQPLLNDNDGMRYPYDQGNYPGPVPLHPKPDVLVEVALKGNSDAAEPLAPDSAIPDIKDLLTPPDGGLLVPTEVDPVQKIPVAECSGNGSANSYSNCNALVLEADNLVSEPGSLSLWSFAMAGLALCRRRRRVDIAQAAQG